MNCDTFSQLTGMRCEPQPTRDGSACVAVVTPFSFFDGDGLSIFAFTVGDKVLLSDEGMTLFWLLGLGHRQLNDRRTWKPLRNALTRYGITLDDDGIIQALAPAGQTSGAFARLVSGLLAVDAWARESAGAAIPLLLKEEAALYLRAWRPQAELQQDPEPVIGLSGLAHSFAMLQSGEHIDVIGPSQAASSTELRKLVDVRASAQNAGLTLRVIVDDRLQAERALLEVSILGRFAKAWPMSRLITAAGGPAILQ